MIYKTDDSSFVTRVTYSAQLYTIDECV